MFKPLSVERNQKNENLTIFSRPNSRFKIGTEIRFFERKKVAFTTKLEKYSDGTS